jgi:hypothetical protein
MTNDELSRVDASIRVGAFVASIGAGVCAGFSSKDYIVGISAAASVFGVMMVFNNAARAISGRIERAIIPQAQERTTTPKPLNL